MHQSQLDSRELGERQKDNALAFGTQVRGFKPGRSRRIFQGEKKPQRAFLRKVSKTVGPMSLIYGM
jgi:hypothetical protein